MRKEKGEKRKDKRKKRKERGETSLKLEFASSTWTTLPISLKNCLLLVVVCWKVGVKNISRKIKEKKKENLQGCHNIILGDTTLSCHLSKFT